jgi:uncharacterized protein
MIQYYNNNRGIKIANTKSLYITVFKIIIRFWKKITFENNSGRYIMKKVSRRSFIKTGSVVGSVMTAGGMKPRSIYAAEDGANIRYRDLGSTGFRVGEVGFGAMNMRDPELVHAAIDSGINYIDTAYKYMNGENERVVGQVMRTKRDKVFLTTKLPETDIKDFPKMIETSLKRLNTDHVDLLLAHGLHEVEWLENEDLIKPLVDAKRKGQARFIGYSTHQFPADYLDATLRSEVWEAVLMSYNYLSPPEVTGHIKKAREAGKAIIAMKTQMQGDGNPDASSDSVSSHQAALKWVLDNPYVDVAIPGMTSFEHLTEDLAVMKMKLSSTDSRELHRFAGDLKGTYCSGVLGCTGCADKCPNGVNVSEINRCLGYAYGYGDTRLAYENYYDLASSSRIEKCSDCDDCAVTCVNGLNLTENVRHAEKMFG